MQDLDELLARIQDHIDSLGLICYPGLLELREDSGLLLRWLDEDWKSFVDLAPSVGSHVIYLDTSTYSSEDFDYAQLFRTLAAAHPIPVT